MQIKLRTTNPRDRRCRLVNRWQSIVGFTLPGGDGGAPTLIARTSGHVVLLTTLLILAGFVGCAPEPKQEPLASSPAPSSSKSVTSRVNLIRQATDAFTRGDLDGAERLIREHLVGQPRDPIAMELAGDLCSARKKYHDAAEYFEAAINESEQPSFELYHKWAKHLMAGGAAFDAIPALQSACRNFPDQPQLRYDLAGLSAMLGLNRVTVEPLQWLVRHGLEDAESLAALAVPSRGEPDAEACAQLLEKHPHDLRPRFAQAKLDSNQFRWQAVATRLQPVVEQHPDCVPVQLLYGRALVELNRASLTSDDQNSETLNQFIRWANENKHQLDQNPDYWLISGRISQGQQDKQAAAQAFARAVELENASTASSLELLARSLRECERDADADAVAKRLKAITLLQDKVTAFHERNSRSQLAAMKIAYQLVELGRLWEANGWSKIAITLPEDLVATAGQAAASIRARLHGELPWQIAAKRLKVSMEFAPPELLPLWKSVTNQEQIVQTQNSETTIRFSDRSTQWNLRHEVLLAEETKTEGYWIHQSVGGGAGAIDFDLDGLPDLAIANLDGDARQQNSTVNQLYRNLGSQFGNVTMLAGYDDAEFAQGITVGDYNNDGWPDVFDCNIGQNRLYQNNGDGTFRDVTDAVGLSDEHWTTSAAIADLNNDGNPEIFEVNYCAGTRPMTKPCRSQKTGHYSSCPPLQFEAQHDRVRQAKPSGHFVDASEYWLKTDQPGRGLGVVVGQFDDQSGIDVYVANDMSVNHFWSAEQNAEAFQLMEQAAARGLAMSGQSRSQASMGMAVGDGDGDGDIDFFLTHFAEEHNTFYEQVSAGIWQDRSYAVGLFEPSFMRLGFGTQWADFDNDRNLDLVLTNGHVSDTGREDIGFEMPPQLFTRQSTGRWDQVDARAIGEYFVNDHLGRALLLLDVNQDQRVDVLITHLYEPVALLVNESQTSHSGLSLYLTATSSHRDAIGTTVRVTINQEPRTFQLTAGDGYMCSNERCVFVGTGNDASVEEIEVQWPSGWTQTFGPLQSGQSYRLIEGNEQAWQFHESN